MYCIYKITNTENGKIYIGRTGNLKRRIKEYRTHSKAPNKRSKYEIMMEMNKYGFDKFAFSVLEDDLTLEESCEREEYWIKELNSTDPSIGYNSKAGGIVGKLAERTTKRINKAKKTNESFYGNFIVLEYSDPSIPSEYQKDPLIIINLDTDSILEFSCAKDAAKALNTKPTTITTVKNAGTTYKGYFVFSANRRNRERILEHVKSTDEKNIKRYGKRKSCSSLRYPEALAVLNRYLSSDCRDY